MRRAGGPLVAALVLSSACTRPNPAFGWLDEAASEGATGTTGQGQTSDDEGTTKTTATSTSEGDQETATSESMSTDDTTDPTPSCEPKPRPFDVTVRDARNVPVVPPCGESLAFAGEMASEQDEVVTISVCASGSCDCGDPQIWTLEFSHLELTPAHALVGDDTCVYVIIAFASADDGCGAAAILMEPTTGEVDHPSYAASNSPVAPFGLLLPPITVAEPLEPCEEHDCEPSKPSGSYHLFVGEEGPIAPGQPHELALNPYASGMTVAYDFVTLFAVVDETCIPHAGWAFARTEG